MDAALSVFSAHGLEAARVEDIAERAGVSKATVYLYFPSKVELFREMILARIAGLMGAAADIPDEGTNAERLEAFVSGYWRQLRSAEFDAVYRLALAEVNAFPELIREYAREVRVPLAEVAQPLLREGVRAGEFSEGDAVVRARMLLALLIKHAVWSARRELISDLGSRTDDEVLQEIMDFYFTALGTVPPSRRTE